MPWIRWSFAISLGLACVLGGCFAFLDFDNYETSTVITVVADATSTNNNNTNDTGTSSSSSGGLDAAIFDQCPDGGGIACLKVNCAEAGLGDATTTVTGQVRDPSGSFPIYNSIAWIPNEPPPAITPAVGCAACDQTIPSTHLAIGFSDTNGTFRLEDVPVGKEIPIVIQSGRWRRVTSIATTACQNTDLTVDKTRLAKSRTEGDIPRIAIVTGQEDPIECLLRRMSIDITEFTPPTGSGRIHMFHDNGLDQIPALPSGDQLFDNTSDAGGLKNYDVVVLPCTGAAKSRTSANIQSLVSFAENGGRVLLTNFSGRDFLNNAYWGTQGNVLWASPGPTANNVQATVDSTSPRGAALSQWLKNQGAIDSGALVLGATGTNVTSVTNPISKIIATPGQSPTFTPSVAYFEFATPIQSPTTSQCGRVAFSDFHTSVASVLKADSGTSKTFPDNCASLNAFSAEELALLFVMFSSRTCVETADGGK